MYFYFLIQPICQVHFSHFNFVKCLYPGPEFNGHAEIAGKARGGISADPSLTMRNLIDTHCGNANIFAQMVLCLACPLQRY